MSDNKENINADQLKEVLTKLHQDIEVPEPSNWDKVHAEIIKHNKRKKRVQSLKQLSSVVAAAILISVLINGNYTNVSAQFTSIVKVIKDEVTYIFMGSSKANRGSQQDASTNSPNNRNLSSIESYNNKELEDNIQKLNFKPIIPSYLPLDFELQKSVIVIKNSTSKNNNLTLIFTNQDGEFLHVDYKNLENIDLISTEVNMDYLLVDEFKIKGNQALYLESNDGNKTIEWITKENIKISIISQINKEELIKVAESIK